jgi:uncharacterized protein YndB with AHSA1/START domain
MTNRSVTHSTFVIEREYAAPPARVFAAWSDPDAKAQWFGASDFELDFRVGGREVNRGGPEGGPVFTYDARYQDIVEGERIVYTYDMLMDDTRISVSVTTVQFAASGDGTRLTYTEQGAFLDGHDTPEQREEGTGSLFVKLGELLEREPANT